MNIAIWGYGIVGNGVAQVLDINRELIEKRAGKSLNIKYILDLREFPGDPYEDRVIHDVDICLNDPDVDIICETMGGNEPAYTFTKRALASGKSVCTSNKELVANHGAELIALAKANQCSYLFEASVGGGIPVIRVLNECLTAETLLEMSGILNGTTNYILTKMEKEGAEFADALKEAQEKGYAEKNPEADVEGYDACRKIAILSSLAAQKTVDYKDIYTEGITKITCGDFDYANAMDMTIKLLAVSAKKDGSYLASVAPYMVAKESPIAGVNDVFNAVFVKSNTLGDTMYYGKGAGKLPTASAVMADVVKCAQNHGTHIEILWEDSKAEVLSFEDAQNRFFVRTAAEDAGIVKELFGKVTEISLEQYPEEFGFVTQPIAEKEAKEKIEKLPGLISRIRIKA